MEDKDIQPRESDPQSHNGKQGTSGIAHLNTSTSSTTVQRTSGKTITGSKSSSPPLSSSSIIASGHSNDTMATGQSQEDVSLVDKLRNHYQKSPKGLKASKFAWILFHFHTTGMLYMMLGHMIPHLLQDYDEMTRYYIKIFYCYLYAMVEANWWCSVLYKSDLPDLRDKPTLDQDDWFQKPPETLKNAETIEPKMDRFGFEWKYCHLCERYKPPRAHHCELCKKCVLRRDHHCYFIGRCVGHYNQRYFVILTFHGIFCALACLPISVSYLRSISEDSVAGWSDYFLPVTLLNFFYYNTATWQFALTTFQCYCWIVLFLWGGFYFTVQISLITEGKTLVELAKQFNMKVTSRWTEHMTMVFGDYWFSNFLFPAQIIFKQRHDGIHYENVKFLGKNENTAR